MDPSRGALANASGELSEALRSLAEIASKPARNGSSPAPAPRPQHPGGGGRPTRAQESGHLCDSAPFPELVTVPVKALATHIRTIADPKLLLAAHAFELDTLARRYVFAAIEDRLRRLGSPLGGPAESPFAGYEALSPDEVVARVDANPEAAANVYAWEWYHARRKRVLKACERRCGAAGVELVILTTPNRSRQQLEPPFPGYDDLVASPDGRIERQAVLARQDARTLRVALAYEKATRRRKTFLRSIENALRRAEHAEQGT